MYTPLYLKTDNSLLSSLISIDSIIEFAKKNNIKSLSITDDNMYGAIEFYNKCILNDIKPIIGLDIEYAVLYCMNYEGYKNLIKLATIKSERVIEDADLKNLNSSLICIVPYKYKEKYFDLKQIYEKIYIGYKNKIEYEKINEPKIYMNEICCYDESDSIYLKYLKAIKESTIIDNIEQDFSRKSFISEKELIDLGYDLKNNYLLTQMCDLKIEKHNNLIPKYKCPDSLDSFSYLKKLCKEGLKRIFGDSVSKKYIERLKYELDIINEMGFCDYFLIVWDYVKYAKEHNILVGPGRGSAAGSLVSYTLNITTVDPIKYNLLFERFLNPQRVTMPDIDIDFEYRYRDDMVKYVTEKYGIKNVAPIITFGTFGPKQVIRDVARSLSIQNKMVDNLCKMIDSQLSLEKNFNSNAKIRDFLKINDEFKKIYKIGMKLENLKRHTSIHAAGVIMCDVPLDEIIPLDKSHYDYYVTGYSMEYLENLGLLKMDFLALKNLTLIKDVIDEVNINFDDIPIDDKKSYEIFTKGDTLGIFQFESDGMINILKKFKPDNAEDIIACIALYRPGPINNIDSYIKRKKRIEKIDYIHDDLMEILKDTYGIIVYQEQIMMIASKMASYSFGEADILRRAMSKKKEEILIEEKDKFIKRSINNGYEMGVAQKVYDLILKFASYGFNRAHSVSYAIISIKMAYLKAHYSSVFMKHLLNMVIGNQDKTSEYINECKKLGVTLIQPNINTSMDRYIKKDDDLVIPFNSVKDVGILVTQNIIKERENGLYTDIFDFASRCYGKSINKKVIENLIYSGCFDELGYNKKTLIENLDVIINYGEICSLLKNELKPIITVYDEYTKKELMNKEFEMFGFYITNHPVTEYKLKYNTLSINEVSKNVNNRIQVILLIDKIRETSTKKNDKMCFVHGVDETSGIDLILFPEIYKQYGDLKLYDIIKANCKVEKRFDKYQLIVNSLEILK